jgi:hypothetical protein
MRVAIDTSYAMRGASGTGVYIERLVAALEADGVDVVRLRQPARGRRGGRNGRRTRRCYTRPPRFLKEDAA